jgi:hypothetical protein
VGLHETPGDVEAQTRAARAPALRTPEELVEQPGELGRRDALAHVVDGDPELLAPLVVGSLDPHVGAVGVLGGVLQQVGEDLFDLVGVGVDPGQLAREAHRDGQLRMADADLLHHHLGQSGDLDHLAAEPQPARLQPGDVEQFGDEAGDAVGVVLNLLEHRALLVVVEPIPPVEQQRGVALDRRERRAQLVGDGGDDLDAAGGQGVAPLHGPQGEDDAFEAPVAVAAVATGDGHPDRLAVAAHHVDFLLRDAPHPGEQRRPGPTVAPDELAVAGAGLEHLVGRGAQKILGRTGEQLGGSLVDGRDRAVGVEHDDGVGHQIDDLRRGRDLSCGAHGASTPTRCRRVS